jgi:fucose 4-O-acetylase-like acetyltransferase
MNHPTISNASRSTLEVDTLRGLACILLVTFHVIGDSPQSGLRIADPSWLTQANELMAYVRMPLFAFLSGYVYAFHPFGGNLGQFVRGKVRRLLLPLLTVGTAFALLQSAMPGSNGQVTNWWLLHISPVGHFWFLQSLFLVFLVVLALEYGKVLHTPLGMAAAWGLSLFLLEYVKAPTYLGLGGALYLLPFFLTGLGCQRFAIDGQGMRMAAALVMLASIWTVLSYTSPSIPGERQSAVAGALLGMSAAFLLLRSGWVWPALARIGAFSFAIYLFHVFFTAASRMVLGKLGVDNLYVLLMTGLAAGLSGPVLVACLIQQSNRLNRCLLGASGGTSSLRPVTI